MPVPPGMSPQDQQTHHGNVASARGQADNAIRLAKSLQDSLYKKNVCIQKVGEASFGQRLELSRKRTDSLDALLTEGKAIGSALARARPRKMSPANLRKYLANLDALVALLSQMAQDATALAEHWREMHRLMDQVAAIYKK